MKENNAKTLRIVLRYKEVLANYERVLKYLCDHSDYFSLISFRKRPYTKKSTNCIHDSFLKPLKEFLVHQEREIPGWGEEHAVMKIYRCSEAAYRKLAAYDNLFRAVNCEDIPENLSFYRGYMCWYSVDSEFEHIDLYAPTQEDLEFFSSLNIRFNFWEILQQPIDKLPIPQKLLKSSDLLPQKRQGTLSDSLAAVRYRNFLHKVFDTQVVWTLKDAHEQALTIDSALCLWPSRKAAQAYADFEPFPLPLSQFLESSERLSDDHGCRFALHPTCENVFLIRPKEVLEDFQKIQYLKKWTEE